MRARERNEQVFLFKRTHIADKQGGHEDHWEEMGPCWASLKPCPNKSFSTKIVQGCKAGTLPRQKVLYQVRTHQDFPEDCHRFKWREKFYDVIGPCGIDYRRNLRTFYAEEIDYYEREPIDA